MNRKDRGALVGMVLGDVHLNVALRTRGGSSWWRSELRILHGAKQREYCEMKAERVRSILGGKFNVRKYKNGKNGAYTGYGFTATSKYFKTLKGMTYYDRKKLYTRRVLDMLTPEGVAIWYMDDGSARVNINSVGKVSSIATDLAICRSKEEIDTVIQYFEEVHDVTFKRRFIKDRNEGMEYYIQANTTESKKFIAIVEPFIADSMRYKIEHVVELNSHECREPVSDCLSCNKSVYDNRRRGLCTTCYSRMNRMAKR